MARPPVGIASGCFDYFVPNPPPPRTFPPRNAAHRCAPLPSPGRHHRIPRRKLRRIIGFRRCHTRLDRNPQHRHHPHNTHRLGPNRRPRPTPTLAHPRHHPRPGRTPHHLRLRQKPHQPRRRTPHQLLHQQIRRRLPRPPPPRWLLRNTLLQLPRTTVQHQLRHLLRRRLPNPRQPKHPRPPPHPHQQHPRRLLETPRLQ